MNILKKVQHLTALLLTVVLMLTLPAKVNATADPHTVTSAYTDSLERDEEMIQDWDNSENDAWMPIILIATAVLIVIFVLLYLQKKKLDKQAKG